MLPIEYIVAPTDFSERSFPALAIACELARHFTARLEVIHVLTPLPNIIPSTATGAPLNADVYRNTLYSDTLNGLADVVRSRIPLDLECESSVVWGSPAEKIVEVADERNADLIVIGTRGATGLARFVSGSVTEKIVRLSKVPVLTVQSEDD
jgi:nucleotide-binding universal stress UspA family protein